MHDIACHMKNLQQHVWYVSLWCECMVCHCVSVMCSSKIEKEKKQLAKDAGFVKTEVSGPEVSVVYVVFQLIIIIKTTNYSQICQVLQPL